jgi:hypothetical protein
MSDFIYVSEVDRYNDIASVHPSLQNLKLVQHVPQKPSDTEIGDGFMERFFARPVHHPNGEITEISKSAYEQLKLNSYYLTISIIWRVSGKLDDEFTGAIRTYTGVKTANAISLSEAEKTMMGIKHQVRNPLQFYVGY